MFAAQNLAGILIVISLAACSTTPGSGGPTGENADAFCSRQKTVRDYDRQLKKLEKEATHAARILASGKNIEDAAEMEAICASEFRRDLQMGKAKTCLLERKDEDGKTYCVEYDGDRCGNILVDVHIDEREMQLEDLSRQIEQIRSARDTAYQECLTISAALQ